MFQVSCFMLQNFLALVIALIIHTISTLGYLGVGFLMMLQTMAIPIPSEVILPFSGFLVFTGQYNLFVIALVGALGSAVGSSIAYYIGKKGGRLLVERYGRYVLISKHDLDLTEKFFNKFEAWAILLGQVLPVVRSFIGLIAGIAKAEYKKFVIYTFLGSFVWSLLLAFLGMKLGANWENLRHSFKGFDYVVIGVIVLGAGLWIGKHLKNNS